MLAKHGVELRTEEIRDNGIPGSEDVRDLDLTEKSYNPWEFPAELRQHIVQPARDAGISPPVSCDVALVDAVYMEAGNSVLIPLANYTLNPIPRLTLEIAVNRPVKEISSVYHGVMKYEDAGAGRIRVQLPLECTDFISIR